MGECQCNCPSFNSSRFDNHDPPLSRQHGLLSDKHPTSPSLGTHRSMPTIYSVSALALSTWTILVMMITSANLSSLFIWTVGASGIKGIWVPCARIFSFSPSNHKESNAAPSDAVQISRRWLRIGFHFEWTAYPRFTVLLRMLILVTNWLQSPRKVIVIIWWCLRPRYDTESAISHRTDNGVAFQGFNVDYIWTHTISYAN